ncbi:GntR family transcriptional repressor for pyruvate dehydrogenase complex [Sphingomonas vulcanisoli]|uniref:GntR family transcriptional repressor for pyruvate dehydrogenase complex n=1 Tax=Sphingomonas vulcanisoli TaxID=1658060 RepID=A0ABX0TRE1_9SPHN|nr:GntR family transcriptional repressor for pyruvate dehydrogenase complex [Sphingomonas vulcanisoli]
MADLIPHGTWRAAKGGGTLSADIVAQIREQLFAGQLRPGDYLGSEASLAQAFDVSRMAMRDALRALSATGVIEIRRGAGGGIRIAAAEVGRFADALAIQLTLLDVSRSDLIEAQIATEAMITRLAAEHATVPDIESLRGILHRATDTVEDGGAFARLLGEFHTALAHIAGNMALAVMLRGILQLLETSYGADTTPARARGVLAKYQVVVDAIATGDADAAALLMRTHLEDVRLYARSGAKESA